jgi:cytochrome oxidase Cu insertion factor (SCO1/SenC/PrrC family)
MKQYFISILFIIGSFTPVHGQTTTISGEIDNLRNDTIKIILQINSITRQSEVHTIPVKKGQFTDTLQITKPTYFYTHDGSNYVNGLIEPSDRITILYNADSANTTLKFKGTGSEKMSFINSLVRLKLYNRLKEQLPIAKTKKYPFDYLFNYSDSIANGMFTILDSIKPFMKPESHNLLSADIKATLMGNKYRSVGLVYHESVEETLKTRQNELTKSSKHYLQNILSFDQTLFYSSSYINEIYNILFVNYDGLILANKAGKNLVDKYSYLSKKLPGKLKIPVLTLFLDYDIGKLNQAEDLEDLISSTYLSNSSDDNVYRNYIEERYEVATTFKKGVNAPDFTVENEKGEKITLASFKGKVVYVDFWYGACGPCHALFQTIEPVKKYFSSKDDVVFLIVSIDRKETWEAALKKYNIPGYHVFTENQESSHPIIKSYKVAGYPTTCLIDRNGKIFMATPSNNPEELQKEIEDALTIESN